MPLEIERKFLVRSDGWRRGVTRTMHIVDHLIARFPNGKARIRVCNNAATLTLKGQRKGLARSEYHVPLETEDAVDMIAEFSTGPGIEKHRHEVVVDDLVWQIDEYTGVLEGLVTSDVELPHENFALVTPDWAGDEITGDPRFGSSRLAEEIADRGSDGRIGPA